MNKQEIIKEMAVKSGLTKKDAEAALNAFMSTVTETVAKGEKISLVGFGSFEQHERAARTGRNPRTKEEIEIPASVVPVFRAGKEFKDAMPAK